MTQKRTVLSTLLALVMVLLLTVPAWAGVTEVTGGTTTNTYTHTYHTRVDATAIFHLRSGGTYEISYDSGFVKGGLSDTAVQDQIKIFNDRVAAYLAKDGAGLSQVSSTEKMVSSFKTAIFSNTIPCSLFYPSPDFCRRSRENAGSLILYAVYRYLSS